MSRSLSLGWWGLTFVHVIYHSLSLLHTTVVILISTEDGHGGGLKRVERNLFYLAPLSYFVMTIVLLPYTLFPSTSMYTSWESPRVWLYTSNILDFIHCLSWICTLLVLSTFVYIFLPRSFHVSTFSCTSTPLLYVHARIFCGGHTLTLVEISCGAEFVSSMFVKLLNKHVYWVHTFCFFKAE
jgi:hypothetical protein